MFPEIHVKIIIFLISVNKLLNHLAVQSGVPSGMYTVLLIINYSCHPTPLLTAEQTKTRRICLGIFID